MTDLEPRHSSDLPVDIPAEADEASTTSKKPERHPYREMIETIVIAALIFLLVRSVVLNFKVDGASMTPTFEGGEMILVNRNAYQSFDFGDLVDWVPGIPDQHWFTIVDWGEPDRGDVIVFTPPEPGAQKPYIKRVIGLPGDQVQISSDGEVRVNGTVLDENYIGDYDTSCSNRSPYCDVTVPPGHVFALGDNRQPGGSEDSRYFGLVSEDRIIGKAWLVYWPIGSISTVDSPDYPELNP